MCSEDRLAGRREELSGEAPITPRGVFMRQGDRYLLCGTIGAEFDRWQRNLSVTSATDAYLSQQIGLEAVERVMDSLEEEARRDAAASGGRLLPRRSPGYADMPLEASREIISALDASRRIGVSITDSYLLVPSKSVTAVCEMEHE